MAIRINRSKIDRSIKTAFANTAKAYAEQMQEELADPQWDWPGITKRQNGETAQSPRDAIDTAEMIDSQQPPVIQESGGIIKASIVYTAGHAAVVFTGWIENQEIYPGRPADKTALQSLNVPRHFARGLKEALGL